MKLWVAVVWMFVGSIIVGYWLTSSALVDSLKDVKNSLTKFYAAFFMTLWMIVIEIGMYAFTSGHYMTLLWALPVLGGLGLNLWLMRDQIGVGDDNYLRSMIQHHSSAILTSKKIIKKTKDEKLKKLAQQIIKSQQEEIDLMNSWL
jgi:hypothetical protein